MALVSTFSILLFNNFKIVNFTLWRDDLILNIIHLYKLYDLDVHDVKGVSKVTKYSQHSNDICIPIIELPFVVDGL